MKFEIKRGDTKRALRAKLKTTDGYIKDLTNCTVKFLLSAENGEIIINREPIIPDATDGEIWVVFTTEELKTVGKYKGEFKVTDLEGNIETFPSKDFIEVTILPDLGRY